MDTSLENQAIDSALKCDWTQAIKLNKLILQEYPDDVEALNRLARAYLEISDLKNAKKTTSLVLKIEPTNKIALKASSKYKSNLDGSLNNSEHNVNLSDFIEETGTTKQTQLLYICSDNLISSLSSGDELLLATHSHKVSVTTQDKKYVGKLADDLSARIRFLTKNGYQFKTIIKSADKRCIRIIIKELKRGKGFENKQSFPREASESVSELSS